MESNDPVRSPPGVADSYLRCRRSGRLSTRCVDRCNTSNIQAWRSVRNRLESLRCTAFVPARTPSMKIIISASAPIGGVKLFAPLVTVAARRDAPARALCARAHARVPPPPSGPGRRGGLLTVKVEVPAGLSGTPVRLVEGTAPRVVLRLEGVSAPWRRPAARVPLSPAFLNEIQWPPPAKVRGREHLIGQSIRK